MRILLDTHIVLWWMTSNRRLPKRADEMIKDAGNEIHVSAVSIWEIAIKQGLGQIEGDPAEIEAHIEPSGFVELPITGRHTAQVANLPSHHRDPFDRLLVAQSLVEPMRLLTSDRQIARYGETVLLV